jgi:hypothetical protein
MNASILTLIRKLFVLFSIWRHANSCKVAQSCVKSVYFRTIWAVMARPVKAFYFRTFRQNFPPSHAKSLAVMVSRAKSAEFHGQRGGYIHTHNSVYFFLKTSCLKILKSGIIGILKRLLCNGLIIIISNCTQTLIRINILFFKFPDSLKPHQFL